MAWSGGLWRQAMSVGHECGLLKAADHATPDFIKLHTLAQSGQNLAPDLLSSQIYHLHHIILIH
jgi:hypothetical protein